MNSTNNWFICRTCKKVFPIKKDLLIHKRSHEEEVQGLIKRGKQDDDSSFIKRKTVEKQNKNKSELSTIKMTNFKGEKKSKKPTPTPTKTHGVICKLKENFQKILGKKVNKNFNSTHHPSASSTSKTTDKTSLLPAQVQEIELICLSSDSEPEPEPELDEKDDTVFQEKLPLAVNPIPSCIESTSEERVEKEEEEEKSSPSSSLLSTQKLSCSLCEWKFVNEKVLAIHMKIRHLNKDYPLSCLFPGCKNVFETPKDLTEHKKSHEPVRKFLCPVESCNRSFFMQHHRSVHLKSHKATAKNLKSKKSLKISKSK